MSRSSPGRVLEKQTRREKRKRHGRFDSRSTSLLSHPRRGIEGVAVSSYLARVRPRSDRPMPQLDQDDRVTVGLRGPSQARGDDGGGGEAPSASFFRALFIERSNGATCHLEQGSGQSDGSGLLGHSSRARSNGLGLGGAVLTLPPPTRPSPTESRGGHGGGSVPNGTSFKRGVITDPGCRCAPVARSQDRQIRPEDGLDLGPAGPRKDRFLQRHGRACLASPR